MMVLLAIVLLLVLTAKFANGLTDAPNAIATVVSTRVLSPYAAIVMAAFTNIQDRQYVAHEDSIPLRVIWWI